MIFDLNLILIKILIKFKNNPNLSFFVLNIDNLFFYKIIKLKFAKKI